ncbi:MAG: hypothetical protein ACK5QX_01895 [bacterium]
MLVSVRPDDCRAVVAVQMPAPVPRAPAARVFDGWSTVTMKPAVFVPATDAVAIDVQALFHLVVLAVAFRSEACRSDREVRRPGRHLTHNGAHLVGRPEALGDLAHGLVVDMKDHRIAPRLKPHDRFGQNVAAHGLRDVLDERSPIGRPLGPARHRVHVAVVQRRALGAGEPARRGGLPDPALSQGRFGAAGPARRSPRHPSLVRRRQAPS